MANSKISALPSATTPLAGTEVLPIVQGGITEQVSVANLTAGRAVDVKNITATGVKSEPIFLAFCTTNDGSWVVDEIVGALQFYSSDASGAGAGVKGGVELVAASTSGAGMDLVLKSPSTTASGNNIERMRFVGEASNLAALSFSNISATTFAAGDVTISNGNLVVGTSGKGIDFSATPSTGTSELLADYEEGTWTVQWFDAATAGNQSASTTTGYYTKVGRIVTINFAQANISTVGMTAANTLFYTLPFTAVNMGEIIGNGMLRAATWPLSSAVQTVQINSYLASGTPSRASFQASVSTVNSVAVTVGAMTSGTSDLYVQLTFAA